MRFQKDRTSRFLVAMMLIAMVALFVGCAKEEELAYGGSRIRRVNINPEYVPIDWDKATLLMFDDNTGTYQIQFSDTVPDIHPGSIISIDRDTIVYYCCVKTANVSGDTVSGGSTEAYLTDIFYDTEFTLSTSNATTSDESMIHPVAVYLLDENGGYQEIDLTHAYKDNTTITHNLWNAPLFNLDGTILAEGEHFKLWLEKMNASLGINVDILLNFGGQTERDVINNMIEIYRSKALKVRAELKGSFDTEQEIRFHAGGNFSYTPDYDRWKTNVFRPVPIRFAVPAGPVVVPIVLKLRCDLFRQVAVSGSGELNAKTGFTDHAEVSGGFEWIQTDKIIDLDKEPFKNNTFDFIKPVISGKGQIQAKAWVFPRIRVMLYDQVGLSFDLMPWLSDTIRGGFREEMLGQTNDYCAWSLDCHAGLDYQFGLSKNHFFFGYEISNNSTDRLTAIDKQLYHSPKKVKKHLDGRPQNGQPATVGFEVYDQNYLLNQEVLTLLPQIVKFEAKGQLSSEYGIANNGRVTVTWTPNGNDTLWAKIYDMDGNVISYDTVIVKSDCDCNLTSGDWVDLGLPSGLLWATRNVGASSPTGYGDYFAWGETVPKNVYEPSTYQYYDNYYRLTKYCCNASYGHDGFTDGRTTLEPGDDAATANYGGRTPTKEEWEELYQNTTHHWTTINGVNGRCFTGSNGNSIFLPASGMRANSNLLNASTYGYYWSSVLVGGNNRNAWFMGFNSNFVGIYDSGIGERPAGKSVRAVRSANKK